MLLLLASLCFAENLWVAAPVEGVRWPDTAVVTVKLSAGDPVEVLARQAGMVRVRKGAAFGWVAAASLTDQEPVKDEPVTTLPGELPAFKLEP